MNTMWQQRRYRYVLSILLALAITGIFVLAVAADAPDPELTPKPVVSMTNNDNGTTTVTVSGGWAWTTHHKDCNLDRAGAGFAVDWNDPHQSGNHVKFLDLNHDGKVDNIPNGPDDVAVGAAAVAYNPDGTTVRNPADNVVHPTPGAASLGGTGDETDVATPSQYALWRGACGTFTRDVNGDGIKDPEGTWGPRSHVLNASGTDSGAQTAGISHTYLNTDLQNGITICAILYDVHNGKTPAQNGGVGIPGGASQIIAGGGGHNSDNGAEKNSGTPLGNTCAPIVVSSTKTTTTPSVFPNDRATVTTTNGAHIPTGSLKFELFRPNLANDCSGTAAYTETVTPLNNGSASTLNTVFIATDVGIWRWRLTYSGDQYNPAKTSPCGVESFTIGNSSP